MKRILSFLMLITMSLTVAIPAFASAEEEVELFDNWRLMEDIAGNFLDSYLKSIYVDENIQVDYSDFVDNEDLINYMEAKKDVYRLTEKYFGEIVDYNVEIFWTGSTEPYRHQSFCDATIYIRGTFNNSDGKDLMLVGPCVFTFVEANSELKIYGVYTLDIVDRSVRGYDRYGIGLPTIYSDMSDELNTFAVDFEEKLAYYSENKEQIKADEVYCTELAIDYLTNYYDELYTQDETDGIFEHKLKIGSGTLESYLQKIAYYENSPKRYGEEVALAKYEFELYEIQFWDGKLFLEILSKVSHYNKLYPNMRISENLSHDYFTFVKNEVGEYVLIDLYRDGNSVRTFDVQNRELPYFDIVLDDYMMVEPVVDYELIKLLDEAQVERDDYLRKELEDKENRDAEKAEGGFSADHECQDREFFEEKDEILSNKVFVVLIIGSFAFSAVAAALSLILVLKKK